MLNCKNAATIYAIVLHQNNKSGENHNSLKRSTANIWGTNN